MDQELKDKLERLINDEFDGQENDDVVVDKNLSISESGLDKIESYLTHKEKLSFNTFFSLNFTSVRSLLTDAKNSTVEYNSRITDGFSTFNGYVWNYDLKHDDAWIATYYDILVAIDHGLYSLIDQKAI